MTKKPKLIHKNQKLEIDRLGHKGDGISSLNGETVFIDGALKGETVQTDLLRGNDRMLRGKITNIDQVLTPAAERISPECAHGLNCGGCAMQHVGQEFYRKWKISRLNDMLAQANLKAEGVVLPPVFIPSQTRRRASFTLLKQNKSIQIGFREKRSHNIINIKECLVLHPAMFDAVQNMHPFLTDILRDSRTCSMFVQMTDSGLDIAFTGELGAKGEPDYNVRQGVADMVATLPIARVSWRRREREALELLLEPKKVLHSFGALHTTLPPMCFLQPSKEGEAAILSAISAGVENHMRNKGDLLIADLFAGCGTLTAEALNYGSVHAYESDKPAVRSLKLALQKIDERHKALQRNLFKGPLTASELAQYNIVIMDPPRAGAKQQAAELAQFDKAQGPDLLIYVSCNPASFIRDAKILVHDGGWKMTSLQMIDQFIWSEHTEACAVFIKN